MSPMIETTCPGCGLALPKRESCAADTRYYNTSPECMLLYTEVLGREFGDAVLYGAVHQLTVDTYALQHAGGPHPDRSVDIHLAGLHLAFVERIRSPYIPQHLQRLANVVKDWPHFIPPGKNVDLTIWDVAVCESVGEQIEITQKWARGTWDAWSDHHDAIAQIVALYLDLE